MISLVSPAHTQLSRQGTRASDKSCEHSGPTNGQHWVFETDLTQTGVFTEYFAFRPNRPSRPSTIHIPPVEGKGEEGRTEVNSRF
jgi:hypothetical protein